MLPFTFFESSTWAALRSAAIERMGEHEVRWRALGTLFAAGGVLVIATLLLPAETGMQPWSVAALAVTALAAAVLMIWASERMPGGDVWISLMLGAGTLMITGAIFFAGVPTTPYALMYVWVGFDSFFFLSRAAACRHLVFAGLCYAAALAALPSGGSAPAARWLMTMGTVAVVGALADVLRERSNRLIKRLGEVVVTDPLTGLLNRRGFEELMANELERARRSGRPISLLVGDLDHFKAINDSFGHRQGDLALQQFSELVQGAKRQIDGAARIGGEEFALILPATDEYGAYLIAERLRRRVRSELLQQGRQISISFGVATGPRDGSSADQLLHSADQALYMAKHLGRDRSVVYSPEVALSLSGQAPAARAAADQLPAVLVLAETLDLRDSRTATHSQTVGRYAEAIAAELGLGHDRVERVRLAGLLHDIGKIGVADPILRKAGPLDDDEWVEMRRHSELGARILAGASLDDISGWVLAHHERPDGTGYPSALGDEQIPLEAKILAVADAFEAMTSDRTYRTAMPVEQAIDELRRCSGSQFDAGVVDAFLRTLHPAGVAVAAIP
jgi:diguanylate cyclase (GGDEF)-like protein/putative nucleotidyltransferase with HDIG domain